MIKRLKRWLLRLLRHKKNESFPQTIKVTDLVNSTLTFIAYNAMEKYRVVSYGSERDALDKLLSVVRPDDTVFDIGASVGLYTMALLSQCPKGEIVAFEPDPETAKRLKQNITLNPFPNVRVIEWGVSQSEGEMELYTAGSGGFAPTLAKTNRFKETVKIPTNSLDNALALGNLPIPDVLKVDIEGAEVLCIRGAKRLLLGEFSKRPRLLFIEFHPEWMIDFGATIEILTAEIESAGYHAIWRSDRDKQTHILYSMVESI